MRLAIACAVLLASCEAETPMKNGQPEVQADESAVMQPVEAFYAAFDGGFTAPADFATDDWNHINPLGGRSRGKQAVLAEVRAVHESFLAGVTDTIQSADVRYAGPNTAVVTVTSVTSPHVLPNDPVPRSRPQIRTFVVVRAADEWLIMQDHNTFIESGQSPTQE